MREIGRIQQGFFATPPRVVSALAKMFTPSDKYVTCTIDPGSGEGAALEQFRNEVGGRDVRCFGIESDQGRARTARERFTPTNGDCLWASIEDTGITGDFPLIWFNPPYDRTRGQGRLELLLFNRVKEWARRGGILIFILPDYVLGDAKAGIALAIEREYEVLSVHHFPEPDYAMFKQVVLVGKRRERAKSKGSIAMPDWAKPTTWPALPDDWLQPKIEIPPSLNIPKVRRIALSKDVILDAVSRSPLRGCLLREAMGEALKVEPPLLPLREGHLALALAGGLCDGVIEQGDDRFLMKGTLEAKILNTKNTERFNAMGDKTADVEHWKTNYVMNVRCLRESGDIEEYTSAEGEEMVIDTKAEEEEIEA